MQDIGAIIYSSIWYHLEDHNIICDEQHGFRSGRSCETQLLITIYDLAQNLNNRKQTDVILLDFTKAFNKVSRKRLCSKIAHKANTCSESIFAEKY